MLLRFRRDLHLSLRVFSVNGVKQVMISLGKDFQATAASPVRFTFASLGVLQGKMAAGDMPDVFIAPSSAIAKAEESPG
ncbi:MAG: hypothetical protein ABSD88_08010 [Candidatus Korobacteraceae bacterium]|jgi:ABC-type molybdate transport system substrate-binding protein